MIAVNGENIDDMAEYTRVKQAFFRTIGPEINPIEANKLGDRFRGFDLVWGDGYDNPPTGRVGFPPLTWG